MQDDPDSDELVPVGCMRCRRDVLWATEGEEVLCEACKTQLGSPAAPKGWNAVYCNGGGIPESWCIETEDGLQCLFWGKDGEDEIHFDVATAGGHQSVWVPQEAMIALFRANGFTVERNEHDTEEQL